PYTRISCNDTAPDGTCDATNVAGSTTEAESPEVVEAGPRCAEPASGVNPSSACVLCTEALQPAASSQRCAWSSTDSVARCASASSAPSFAKSCASASPTS